MFFMNLRNELYKQKLRPGIRVRYVPSHAKGNTNHDDCEDGVISTVQSDDHVFVKYDFPEQKMVTGQEPYTSQRTRVVDIICL